MVKVKTVEITNKDLIYGIIALAGSVIGYFVNLQLGDIREAQKNSLQYQIEQRVEMQKVWGEVNLLHAKDIYLEEKIENKNGNKRERFQNEN